MTFQGVSQVPWLHLQRQRWSTSLPGWASVHSDFQLQDEDGRSHVCPLLCGPVPPLSKPELQGSQGYNQGCMAEPWVIKEGVPKCQQAGARQLNDEWAPGSPWSSWSLQVSAGESPPKTYTAHQKQPSWKWGSKVPFWGDENILKLCDGRTAVRTCQISEYMLTGDSYVCESNVNQTYCKKPPWAGSNLAN